MRASEIRELVKIVEESNIHEIEITKWWGRKIRISKSASITAKTNVPTPASTIEIHHEEAATTAPGAPLAPEIKLKEEPSNLIEIKAPMVGTFYRAPAPDADSYVEEGDMISPGKVLCIIEAMKLMNEIEAEISGQITKILVENAQPVEFNQPLFLIKPS